MESTTPFQPWTDEENTKNVKTERELVDDAKLHRENVNHPKHRQTASYVKESIVSSNISPGPSSASSAGAAPAVAKESRMDSGKVASMQQIVENALSQEGRQRVTQLLEAVEALSGAERLLLYLRLPTGVPPHDPLKQPINPLGSRAELQQTVTWIQTHLEVDPDVSLPKQDVYDEYITHCMSSNMKPLSTADFGKVMKQVYPTVRPRRLGTRGNSRYCYAGLRKKIKLEVPQLPDLGESSKFKSSSNGGRDVTATYKLRAVVLVMLDMYTDILLDRTLTPRARCLPKALEPSLPSRENERIICDWAETKLGIKFANISELSRHLASPSCVPPPVTSPPPLAAVHAQPEEASGRQLIRHLKRKLQVNTQGTPGRPKKNKGQDEAGDSPPSTSYAAHAVKHESELPPEAGYGYQYGTPAAASPSYVYSYAAPPRAHPTHPAAAPHPALPVRDYPPEPYAPPYPPSYTQPYARDLTAPDAAHNLPINLSSDASLDLSTERSEWPRRRPPDPTPRLHLPGKKLILETYQSETQASSPRPAQTVHQSEEFPRAEYLPKKMRAAEILGGKLAPRQQAPPAPAPAAPAPAQSAVRSSEVAFLEDSKNLTNRSKSTAAALAREEQEAASPTQSVKAPTPKYIPPKFYTRAKETTPERAATPDSCCGLDGINIKTGMICEEKHSEILNRERVISICNIDKHALDDYLNEGNSQEHDEELLQYFQPRVNDQDVSAGTNPPSSTVAFLERGQDPQDDHSQGKSEKISQLRELLAKNLKNQSGSNSTNLPTSQEQPPPLENHNQPVDKNAVSEGAFKPVANVMDLMNGPNVPHQNEMNGIKQCNSVSNENSMPLPYNSNNTANLLLGNSGGTNLFNGNCHNEPQSPTTRTQQYDFVPISDGCHSPGNFHSKSPLSFGQRGHSPSKVNKTVILGGSLQTSPISHSTAASPFVSPRNTPVPRSRLCPRPIPKHNGRKRRNPLSLGVGDPCPKQFAVPNDQKILHKSSIGTNLKYYQRMSAPPSPNLTQYKNPMLQNSTGMQNGNGHMSLNFMPNALFREHVNGELTQPLSADPLSSEVSKFFQEPIVNYRLGHDQSFRSQSVPLKQGMNNVGLLSYNNTPVGSVPPTPVPNEFCDFGSLADTCDISKAGLNPETLDKIYDAIDSSNDVLNTGAATNLLNSNDTLTNGCDSLPDQQILTEEHLSSYIPNSGDMLDRSSQFNQSFPGDAATTDNVEEFLKRANSIEFDLTDFVSDKTKYYTSRSVPSTPLPFKRTAPNLQIDSRRSRELFAADSYSNISNGISSKSVPSTPQLAEDHSVFSYSNRDFLINGNSVEISGSTQIRTVVDNDQGLTSPLDMLREDILDPLTPAADLLADLDKIDGTPYVDL